MDTTPDLVQITELLNRHQIYIDLKDPDGYASLYAEDGRYESPFSSATGRAEIREMFISLRDQGFTAGKRHMTGPVMVDIDGESATARSWYWVAETEQAPAVYATGTYTDELTKVDGHWKIAHRVQTLDPSATRNQ
jgi:ketosteroid isomerase-like protein